MTTERKKYWTEQWADVASEVVATAIFMLFILAMIIVPTIM